MKRVHRGRDKCKVCGLTDFTTTKGNKVSLEIQVKKVTNLGKELNGSTVFLSWRRGTKKTSGDTKRVLANKQEAVWDEKIVFETKLFIDPKTQKIDEKKLTLSLKEDNAKKKATKKLSSVSIDLSNFVTNSDPVVIPIGKNSKTAPLLHATFKTKALKYNTKMLVKVEPGSRTERDSRLVKKIIGEEYFLDRTDSDLSPTTMDTASVASDDESDFTFDADEASSVNNDNDVADSELRKRVDDLQQQLDAIEAESFERLTVIREKDKELATAQKRLAASERELADKTAQLEKQQEDKDELLTQLERLKKPAGRGEADTLRAEAVAHLSTINTLEKDIERLKREAKDREKEKDRDRDKDRENDRSKDKNKESEATILRLQQENDRLSKLLREKESAAETRPSYKSRAARDDDDDGERNGGLGGRLEMARKGASSSGDAKQMASLRQELEEKLLLEKSIYCVEPQLRSGLPISAGLIFEALQSWSSLQPQDKSYGNTGSKSITTVTAGIDLAIKRARYDNGLLCYWLATVITLLSKLRHKQESEWNGPSADALDSAASTMSPATRLEFSLTATLGKAYSMLVKNICLQLDPLLVPVMLYHHVMPRGTTFSSGAGVVVHMVDELYRQLQEYHVHNGLITQIFSQVLYYVDAVLFNALATRKDLCTCAHGFRVRLQVSRLEEWIPSAFVGVRDQLAPAVQAAKLLVMDKHLLASDPDIFLQVSPKLTASQIRQILANYIPDTLSPDPLPPSLINTLDRLPPALDHPQTHNNSDTVEIDPDYVSRLSLSFISSK